MRKTFILILVLSLVLLCAPKGFCASEEEIQTLKLQVYELMKRIEQLEQSQIKQKEDFAKQKEEIGKKVEASRIDLANTLSKLKIKGRWAAGFFDSDKTGSYPSGSWEIPEGKIQFAFQPDDINTVIMRFNVNNATAQSPLMDYFFCSLRIFYRL